MFQAMEGYKTISHPSPEVMSRRERLIDRKSIGGEQLSMEKIGSNSQLSPKVLELGILHIWAIFVKANYMYTDNRGSWSLKVKRVLGYF